MKQKLVAELIGTFWLVLAGCGTAVLAGSAVGTLGISLSFGLAVLTGAYALGHISGGHFNPAVSFGLWVAGRFPGASLLPYVVAQLLGAILAAYVLYLVAQGYPDFLIDRHEPGAFASNGYGTLSPSGYSLGASLLIEIVLTAMFLVVILAATRRAAVKEFAPLAIGFALVLIHLISIPITNTSVNPARSTGVALIVGAQAIQQLWLFWVAPMLGAALGSAMYRLVCTEQETVQVRGLDRGFME